MKLVVIIALFLLITTIPPSVQGVLESDYQDVDYVIINSNNWEDIYQGLLYAHLIGKESDYLFAPSFASAVAESIPKQYRTILLLETSGSEQVKGYETFLTNKGYQVRRETGASRLGLRLAQTITPNAYIVTDQRYPYNAVALIPYALLNDYYILFGDELAIDQVLSILSEKQRPLITYGILNNRVTEELSIFNPEIIDEGGKFDNNLYVVNKFIQQKPVKQVILTNGEFIELGLFQSEHPILFIGRTRTPPEVATYLVQSDIQFFVVVGNHLSQLASRLKTEVEQKSGRSTSMFVRFAKTPRVITSSFAEPQGLEYVSLPIINPELLITKLAYNRLSNMVEVTYQNPSEITVFFTSTFTLSNPSETLVVGDEDVQVIVSGQEKTLLYQADMSPESLRATTQSFYGDYPKTLEYELSGEFTQVPIIDVSDDSLLEIVDVVYDKRNKAFYITVTNPSSVELYAHLELVDIIVDGVVETVGTRTIFSLEPGETTTQYIRARLSELDLLENENILIRGLYGEREQVRFKVAEKTLYLKVRLMKTSYIIAGSIIIVIVLLLLIFLLLRTSYYECDRCAHQTKRRSSARHACGGTYKKK